MSAPPTASTCIDWWDSVYDDFERICTILGVTLDALQPLQRPNFYQLAASFRQTGRLCGMTVAVDRDSPTGQPIVDGADDDLVNALRDLAHWLCRALERECGFQTADETIDEGMSANGYTFTAEGRRFG